VIPLEEGSFKFDNILLFGKYSSGDVVVNDGGLAKYINLTPTAVPHTTARHANKWFGKSKVNIVERLINNMMRTEVFTGKKLKAYNVTKKAFEIIEQRTKAEPDPGPGRGPGERRPARGDHPPAVRRDIRPEGGGHSSLSPVGHRAPQHNEGNGQRLIQEHQAH